MRLNGCQWPPHPLQALSWVLLAVSPLQYYGLALPLLDIELRVCFSVAFALSFVVVIVSMAAATMLNPSCPKKTDNSAKTCGLCQLVVDETCKHCSCCGRCTAGFDHHCKWLNNCVGRRNYRYFLTLVASLEVLILSAFLGNACALGIAIDTSGSAVLTHFSRKSSTVVIAVYGATLLADAVGLLVNGQLICFHIWLRKHGLTTFQYVSRRRTEAPQSAGEQEPAPRKLVLMKSRSFSQVQPAKDFSVLFSIPTAPGENEPTTLSSSLGLDGNSMQHCSKVDSSAFLPDEE